MNQRPAIDAAHEVSPARWALAVMVTFTMTMATMSQFVVGTLAPFLTVDLGLTRAQLGLLTTAPFIVAMVASPVAGIVVDRVRDRQSLTALFLVVIGMYAGFAAAPSVLWIAVAIGIGGLAQAVTNPVTNKLIARHTPVARRGVIIGLKQSGVQFGGLLCGGLLPTMALAWGWRTAVSTVAALGVVGLVIVPRIVPAAPKPRKAPAATDRRTQRSQRVPGVGALTVYALLMGGGVSAAIVYLPLYAHEQLTWSPSLAGLTIAASGFVAVAARIGWGRLSDRVEGPLWAMLAVLAAGAVVGTSLSAAAVLAPPLLWLGVAILGASAMAWNSIAMIAAVRLSGTGHAGRITGIVNAGFFGGYMLSPPLFGWIVDLTSSYTAAWMALLAMDSAALFVALGRGWVDRTSVTKPMPAR